MLSNHLIVIPTYNEVEALPQTLHSLFTTVPEAHVLIVDDDSPDGTHMWVQQQIDDDVYSGHLHLLHRTQHRSFAKSYKAGCDYFLDGPWQTIQLMDADGSHPIETIPQFVQCLYEGYDLVVGSRYAQGGGYEDWPWHRVMLSSLAQKYVQLLLGGTFSDWTSGFVALRRELLQKLPYASFQAQGFAILMEFKAASLQQGARVQEIPILFKNRELGVSKITKKIILEGLQTPWYVKNC